MAASLHLLGGAALRGSAGLLAGAPAQRHRIALLALLAAAHPGVVTRDRLVALLWAERDARRGRALLSLAVHVLRRALGGDAIRASGDALALDGDVLDVDVIAFMRARERGDVDEAIARWGGAFLEGFHLGGAGTEEFERWLDATRARYAADHADALAEAAGLRRARGDGAGARDAWRRLAAQAPHDGSATLRAMRGLASLGARGEALDVARRHAAALRADFDAEPTPAVESLAARIRARGRHAPDGGRRAPAVARSGVPVDRDEAEVLCLKGRHFWAQRGPEQLRKAVAYFERARAADPRSAAALAGIADSWALLGFYSFVAPGEAFAKARRAARAALALEPDAAESFASLAYVRMYHDWRWDAAVRGYRRALRIDPRHAKAHQWLGNLLVLLGRHDDAIAQMRQVRALMPVSPMAHAVNGWACYHAGRHEAAEDHLLESLELEPNFPVAHLWLGQTRGELGRWDEAVASLRRASELFHGSPIAELGVAYAQARGGARAAAEGCVERLRAEARRGVYVPSYELAKAELALGNRTAALRALGRAYRERSLGLAFLRADPHLAALRAQGSVDGIAKGMGL